MNKKKKVIFLPENINPSSAPFNRFYTMYKMIHEAGYLTSIIFVQPQREDKIDKDIMVSGDILSYESLTYCNIKVFPVKSNLLQKISLKLKVYINASKIIHKESKKYQLILYLNSNELKDYIFFNFIAKIYSLKFIKEFNEYPRLIRKPKKHKTAYYNFFIRSWRTRFFDGLIIMTQSLIDFHIKYKGKNTKIVKIPMTVDPARFENCITNNSKYLGYVGGLNCKKDGLDILIKAFALISGDFPDYNLKIAGSSNIVSEIEYLENLVKELNISNRVHFVGALSRVEIPIFLLSATILILARPKSKQAEGGFPTKLGEYLISGKPVIVTKVGEIPDYLKDKVDAYLIKPGNVKELAEKMEKILTNPDEAEKVGQRGKQTAINYFDYKSHSIRLKEFFNSL